MTASSLIGGDQILYGPGIIVIVLCLVLGECKFFFLMQTYLWMLTCFILPFRVASVRFPEWNLLKAVLSAEANSKPTCSLWARITCLASANHFLSEANCCLCILPVRSQTLSLYAYAPPTCLTIAPLWFPACHKWCSIGILLMLDTMMLCSDPLFSLADLFSSLGKISWWSLQLCPFLSSDLSKTTICSKGKAKSRVANRDLEKNNS